MMKAFVIFALIVVLGLASARTLSKVKELHPDTGLNVVSFIQEYPCASR